MNETPVSLFETDKALPEETVLKDEKWIKLRLKKLNNYVLIGQREWTKIYKEISATGDEGTLVHQVKTFPSFDTWHIGTLWAISLDGCLEDNGQECKGIKSAKKQEVSVAKPNNAKTIL